MALTHITLLLKYSLTNEEHQLLQDWLNNYEVFGLKSRPDIKVDTELIRFKMHITITDLANDVKFQYPVNQFFKFLKKEIKAFEVTNVTDAIDFLTLGIYGKEKVKILEGLQ